VTAYKEIQGISVQTVAGDPPAPLTGQIWYNSSTGTFRVNKTAEVGSWATGNDVNTAIVWTTVLGTQSSALKAGGGTPGAFSNVTESYNGTNWTTVNSMNTARGRLGGAGASNTNGLVFGGYPGTPPYTADTELWNGTNWTEVNNLNTGRAQLGSAGTSNTAALAFQGEVTPDTAATEEWNGTNWTTTSDANNATRSVAGSGTQTSAISSGGNPSTTNSEIYNGSSWTAISPMNTARVEAGGIGISNTSALVFGNRPDQAITEHWNGTAWSEVNDLNTGRSLCDGTGSFSFGLAASGGNAGAISATEEWTTAPSAVTETITEV
jgi:hypothetical protein